LGTYIGIAKLIFLWEFGREIVIYDLI